MTIVEIRLNIIGKKPYPFYQGVVERGLEHLETVLEHWKKKQFLDLLLLADEQESMIDKYLERGEMFALYDDGLKAISVVTCEGEGIYEIKNIAVCPSSQRKGYGKRLVDYLFGYYQGRCSVMLVGTGDTPSTLSFYEHCGFRISHRLKNFFTDNYDHPIYEDGKLLTDMVYLRKDFS